MHLVGERRFTPSAFLTERNTRANNSIGIDSWRQYRDAKKACPSLRQGATHATKNKPFGYHSDRELINA